MALGLYLGAVNRRQIPIKFDRPLDRECVAAKFVLAEHKSIMIDLKLKDLIASLAISQAATSKAQDRTIVQLAETTR